MTSRRLSGHELFVNTDFDSMASDLLPSQIPVIVDSEAGTSVDDSFGTSGTGPWTSTQNSNTFNSSDDRMYGENGTTTKDSSSQQKTSDEQDMNFSTGPNFSLYANSSEISSAIDSASLKQGIRQSPKTKSTTETEDVMETDCREQECESNDMNERKGANYSAWSDASLENEMLKCDESGVQEVRKNLSGKNGTNERVHGVITPIPNPHTTSTSNSAVNTQKEKGRLNEERMGTKAQTNDPTQTTGSSDILDNSDSQSNNNPTSNSYKDSDQAAAKSSQIVTEVSQMKTQMDNILHALQNMTTKMVSNQEQQTNSQVKTQQALDANKQASKKTQEVIDSMHQDIRKAHQDIKSNQNQTQQAFQAANIKLANVTAQVNKTFDALTEVKKEIKETKEKTESNTKKIHDARTDIQYNKDEIQSLKDEVKELKTKQTEQDKLHERQQAYNDRNDTQRDRQEIHNRRSNVVFYGIPEKKDRGRERTDEVVIDFLQHYMPERDWTENDCGTAYRAGRRYQGGKPRPIIATFDKPSDVAYILKNRQSRDDMKKDGFGCGQDLTRAQRQKIDDIRMEGKQAYYTRGRLVVRDPHFDFRSRSRHDNEERHRHRRDIRMNIHMDRHQTTIEVENSEDENTSDRREITNQRQNDSDNPIVVENEPDRDEVSQSSKDGVSQSSKKHGDDVRTETITTSHDASGQTTSNVDNDSSRDSRKKDSYSRHGSETDGHYKDHDKEKDREEYRRSYRLREENNRFFSPQRQRWSYNADRHDRRYPRYRQHQDTDTDTRTNPRSYPSSSRRNPDYRQNPNNPSAQAFSFSSHFETPTQPATHSTRPKRPNQNPFHPFSTSDFTSASTSNSQFTPPPSFQQFQQMHNFFSNLFRFFPPPQPGKAGQDYYYQNDNSEKTHTNGDKNDKDSHTRMNEMGPPPPPPPPPPPSRGGGGRV